MTSDLIPKTGKVTTEVPDFIDVVRDFLEKERDTPLHGETIAVLEKRVARDLIVD